MKLFEDIIKAQPSVGDAHMSTALDDETDEVPGVSEDDCVQIYTTKAGAVEGFDGRRLEPISETICKFPLTVAKASFNDIQPGVATTVLTAMINRTGLVMKSVEIDSLRFFDAEIYRPEVEKRVIDLGDGTLEQPIVVKVNDENCVVYGTGAVLARWLNGEDRIAVKYLEPTKKNDDALGIKLEVKKANPDQQQIFGWASVVTKNGKAIVDKQGDVIDPAELEKAFYEYVLKHRHHGHMHSKIGTGQLIECMVFTKQKQDALGIDLGFEGAWVGYQVDDPAVWAAHKRGALPEFSIGGFAEPVDI